MIKIVIFGSGDHAKVIFSEVIKLKKLNQVQKFLIGMFQKNGM